MRCSRHTSKEKQQVQQIVRSPAESNTISRQCKKNIAMFDWAHININIYNTYVVCTHKCRMRSCNTTKWRLLRVMTQTCEHDQKGARKVAKPNYECKRNEHDWKCACENEGTWKPSFEKVAMQQWGIWGLGEGKVWDNANQHQRHSPWLQTVEYSFLDNRATRGWSPSSEAFPMPPPHWSLTAEGEISVEVGWRVTGSASLGIGDCRHTPSSLFNWHQKSESRGLSLPPSK